MCGVGYLRFNCRHHRMMWQDCELAGDCPLYIRHACPNFRTHTKIVNRLCGSGPGHHCSQTEGGKLVEEAFDFFKQDGPLLRLKKLNAKVERVARAIQGVLLHARSRSLSHLEPDSITLFDKLKASFDKAYGKRNVLVADKCRYEKVIKMAEDHFQLQEGPPDASTATPEFLAPLQRSEIPLNLARDFASQRDRAILRMMPHELAANTGLLEFSSVAEMDQNQQFPRCQPARPLYQQQNMQQAGPMAPPALPFPGQSSQQMKPSQQYLNPTAQQQNLSQVPTQQVRQPKRKRVAAGDAVSQAAEQDDEPPATSRSNAFLGLFQSYQQASKYKVASTMMVDGRYSADRLPFVNDAQMEKLQSVQDVSNEPTEAKLKPRGRNATSRNVTASASESNGLRRSRRTRGSNVRYKESPSSAPGWSSEDPSPAKSAKSDAAWRYDDIEASEDSESPVKRRQKRQMSSELKIHDANPVYGAGAYAALIEKIKTHKRLADQAQSVPSQTSLQRPFPPDGSGQFHRGGVPGGGEAMNVAGAHHGTAYAGADNSSMGPPQYSKALPAPATRTVAPSMGIMPLPNMYTRYAGIRPPASRALGPYPTVPGNSPYLNNNQGHFTDNPYNMAPVTAYEDPFYGGPSQSRDRQLPPESWTNLASSQGPAAADVLTRSIHTASSPSGTMSMLTSGYQPPDRSESGLTSRQQFHPASQQPKPSYEQLQNTTVTKASQPTMLHYTELQHGHVTPPSTDYGVFSATDQPSLAAPFPSLDEENVVNLHLPTTAPYPDYERLRRSFSASAQLTPRTTAVIGDASGLDTDPSKRAVAAPSPSPLPNKRARLSFPGQDDVPVFPSNLAGFDFRASFLNTQIPGQQNPVDSAYDSQSQGPVQPPDLNAFPPFDFTATPDTSHITTGQTSMQREEPEQEVTSPQTNGAPSGELQLHHNEALANNSDGVGNVIDTFDFGVAGSTDDLDWGGFTEDWMP